MFIGQVPLKLNITHGKYAELLHVEGEILAMVSVILEILALLMGRSPLLLLWLLWEATRLYSVDLAF